MKWYFACNEKSTNFFPLIKAAVNSALENTTLEPIFIYDGKENELTNWLEAKGVKIIFHRVSFYDALEKNYDEAELAIASGAFLRCDIPLLEHEDKFVLYTDCDILFLKDFQTNLEPKYFACSAQHNIENFKDFNSGVMLMNTEKLRESHKVFSGFIIKNINILSSYDQTAYQLFYDGKNTKLPTIFNHKPYWGVDENAVILHFHGAKPINFVSDEKLKTLPPVYSTLYRKNPLAYDFYLNLFQKYYPEIEYETEAINKLKNGVYPLTQASKRPFITRIKNFLTKKYLTFKQKVKFVNKFNL